METAAKETTKVATKKLYIGSLPYSWSVDQLEDLFKPFGRVTSTAIVSDQVTKKSKGFGFVEMESEDAAAKAMTELNGKEVDGRPLSVREAKPNMDRNNRSESGGYGQRQRQNYEYNDPTGTDTTGRTYGNRNGWW
jgi:RNA recognition motif-containing protein